VQEDIIEHKNLNDFESFLNNVGIKCKLAIKDDGDRKKIDFIFKNKKIPFSNIASSGTKSLLLFYFWYQRLKENSSISFLFLDEFDAHYHHSLSKTIIEKLKEISNTQIILTTHNTSIISNDLLRPDCYFLMYEDGIKSLSNSTAKELREAHNIEKMYKAGSFGK
jgi:AAA15 family ATPase/GTPase